MFGGFEPAIRGPIVQIGVDILAAEDFVGGGLPVDPSQ